MWLYEGRYSCGRKCVTICFPGQKNETTILSALQMGPVTVSIVDSPKLIPYRLRRTTIFILFVYKWVTN